MTQPSLFDQPPTRLADVTIQDWDWRHPAESRQLRNEALACIGLEWWRVTMEAQRAERRTREDGCHAE